MQWLRSCRIAQTRPTLRSPRFNDQLHSALPSPVHFLLPSWKMCTQRFWETLMATFGLIEYQDAAPEVRAVYDDIMATRKIDWINNFWKRSEERRVGKECRSR